jgi:Putative transposase, YhgA-like
MGQDHDSLFRYTFSQPEQAAALLRSLLPSVLVTAIDWERIRPVPGSFVDGRLASHFADLLFEAPLHGVPTLLYAFSNTSRPATVGPRCSCFGIRLASMSAGSTSTPAPSCCRRSCRSWSITVRCLGPSHDG